MDHNQIHAATAEERRAIADLIDDLDEAQLATPSLCAGWDVKTVQRRRWRWTSTSRYWNCCVPPPALTRLSRPLTDKVFFAHSVSTPGVPLKGQTRSPAMQQDPDTLLVAVRTTHPDDDKAWGAMTLDRGHRFRHLTADR